MASLDANFTFGWLCTTTTTIELIIKRHCLMQSILENQLTLVRRQICGFTTTIIAITRVLSWKFSNLHQPPSTYSFEYLISDILPGVNEPD
ncbi:hypothetical protein BLOT_002946 [Blomia tropicalis]|nr:hypothetical protein BLOT_002946 [Blomia tropicalis]